MSDMSNYLSNEIGKAVENSNAGADHQLRNIALRQNNIEQLKGLQLKDQMISDLQQDVSSLRNEVKKLKTENTDLKRKLSIANDEAEEYSDLLCKPMYEIAARNGNFRETYEEQQTIFADWMVSQKAFKELAIQFGFEKGQSAKETIQQGLAKEIDVLMDKHNSEHKTNVGDSSVIGPRKQKLIDKFNSERSR